MLGYKLTIILTVYNKEPYLHRAFSSLLGQEGTNKDDYEILVINDGSTDGSLTICEEYTRKVERVRVITQTNQGLSMARNNGLEAAKGEYVWFVDSDDVISTKAVSLICQAMTSKPDIIPIYAKTKGVERVRNRVKEDVQTGKEILTTGGWEQCGVFNVLRREFMLSNNLRFMPGVFHEDAEFTPRMLYTTKSVKVVPEVLYTVIHEPNSITSTPCAKRAFDCMTVAESLSRFVEEKGERGTTVGKVIDGNASLTINNGFAVITQNSYEEQKLLNLAFFEKRKLLISSLLDSAQRKYRIEAGLFKMFPKQYVWVYKMMKLFSKRKYENTPTR